MIGVAIILTMKKVVIVIINVVVTLISTTKNGLVVEKLTMGNSIWSLIVLTTELLTTMDDHTFVVVNTF
jgi:hypothetical protein